MLRTQVTSLLSSSSLIHAVSWEITDIDSVSSVTGFDVRLKGNQIYFEQVYKYQIKHFNKKNEISLFNKLLSFNSLLKTFCCSWTELKE